jgi:hypothetical protein
VLFLTGSILLLAENVKYVSKWDIVAEGPLHFPPYVGDAQRCSPGIWVGLILACAPSTPVLRHLILAIFEFCFDIPGIGIFA